MLICFSYSHNDSPSLSRDPLAIALYYKKMGVTVKPYRGCHRIPKNIFLADNLEVYSGGGDRLKPVIRGDWGKKIAPEDPGES